MSEAHDKMLIELHNAIAARDAANAQVASATAAVDAMREIRDRTAGEISKIAAAAEAAGWNGTDNSKFLHQFITDMASERDAAVQDAAEANRRTAAAEARLVTAEEACRHHERARVAAEKLAGKAIEDNAGMREAVATASKTINDSIHITNPTCPCEPCTTARAIVAALAEIPKTVPSPCPRCHKPLPSNLDHAAIAEGLGSEFMCAECAGKAQVRP